MQDGRILFEVASGSRELFTVYPDGTGVESVRCQHGIDRSDARQVSSGDFVFVAGSRLARFTPESAVQTGVDQPRGDIGGPVAEVGPGDWIVSLRRADGRFGLYRWSAASQQAVELDRPANMSAVQPAVVTPRVPPKRFPSALLSTRSVGQPALHGRPHIENAAPGR